MRLLALPLAAALLLTACGTDDADGSDGSALEVVVGVYPYAFVLERVGGEDVDVSNLTPPGAEPHDLELSPRQVGALGSADLVVYSAGFQPALDDAVEQQAGDRALDVLTLVETREGADDGHADEHAEDDEHNEDDAHNDEGVDPHLWLDPTRLAEVTTAVADRLADLAPERADDFRARADALTAELATLDTELRDGLASCARRDVVTSHAAFGYLTEAYDLEQVAISGLSPEAEPTPGRLAEVTRIARERGVTTIFFEELVSPRVAEQLAREVGAQTAVLNPLEGAPDDGDYLTAMRDNLDTLRGALDCA